MTLHCEVAGASAELAAAVVASIREVTTLRGEMVFCAANALPDDGKVIADLRSYE